MNKNLTDGTAKLTNRSGPARRLQRAMKSSLSQKRLQGDRSSPVPPSFASSQKRKHSASNPELTSVSVDAPNGKENIVKKNKGGRDTDDSLLTGASTVNFSVELQNSVTSNCIVASQTLLRDGTRTADAGPSNRWGHSMCMISENEAVLTGGQGDRHILCKDAIWRLDMTNGRWSVPETQSSASAKPESRMGHSTVFDPKLRSVYVFGGSKNKKWFNDVQTIDTDTWQWQCVQAAGNAPSRSYHTSTLYGHEMWVFGGVFPRPDPEPDGCSNDIYVFSLLEEMWYTPLVMGVKPQARSGHSATLFESRLVVFGGWDAPVCFNDVHILDLSLVEWITPVCKGTPPSPRSWHSSCALSGSRLFIHGGYNGNVALNDSFIFDLDTMTWSDVVVEPSVLARTGHVAVCLPFRHDDSNPHDEVLLFGGGDNEGKFFNDLISLSIPNCTSLSKVTSLPAE